MGLVKTLEKSFKRKLGPFPDTLQAGACILPPFLRYHPPQFLPTDQYQLCFGYAVSGLLTQRSHYHHVQDTFTNQVKTGENHYNMFIQTTHLVRKS